jgi:hypothetical protein
VGTGGSGYGSITEPSNIGSGGGYNSGGIAGAGGGAIKLTVSGTTTVTGGITANGQTYVLNYSGGGSGGSVWINTGTLTGAGSITVNGGNGSTGSYPDGGGGGGRVAIYYTTDSSTITYQAFGGTGYSYGGAGTVYKKSTAQANGDLTIDNNDQDTWEDRYIGRTVLNNTFTFDTINIQNYGNLETGTSSNITYSTLNWDNQGIITDNGGTFDLVSGGGTLTIPTNARLVGNAARTFTGLTVNGTLTHTANTTAETYKLNYTINGDVLIASGGAINVNGKGYQHSEGPGAGADTGGYAGGAGYGGEGADGSTSAGGPTYGSITEPNNLGSGGGDYNYNGGAGGGAIKLIVSGTTTVTGDITANGANAGADSGGGSGGSIWINTGSLEGAGSVTVNGGTGEDARCGGGGGGRIAMYYTTDSSTIIYQAYGGGPTGRYGGAGTIYLKGSGQTYGDLLIDGNDQDSWDDRFSTRTLLDSAYNFNTITIQNYGNLELGPSANITYSTLNWFNEGVITDNGGIFALVSGGGNLTIPATARLVGNTSRTFTGLTVNGTLTHSNNTTSETYKLNYTINGDVLIGSGGVINVNGKGYQHSEGPGAGVDTGGYAGGAGYGGDGADGSTSAGGSAYGSLTEPNNLGSGGGDYAGYGGAGGGAIKLVVSGTTTVTGSITANGANAGTDSGGGSGGSIWISTVALVGAGTVTSNGGTGEDANCGGGGGGRIAMYYATDSSTLTYQAYGGSPTGRYGGAGTIYTKPSTQTYGDLLIDNNSHSGDRTPIITSAWTLDDVTIQNSANLDLNSLGLTVYGDFLNSSGTLTHSNQTVTFASNTTGRTITPGGSAFYTMIFDGVGGEWTVNGALDCDGNLNLVNGSLTAPSSTINLAGNINLYAGTTFNANGGTVILDGTGTQSITSNSHTYSTIDVRNVDNIVTFEDSFTTTDFTIDSDSYYGTVEAHFKEGLTYVITGALTLDGASGEEITLNSKDNATRFTFGLESSNHYADYLIVSNSQVTGHNIYALSSTNGGNTDASEASPHWVFFGNGYLYIWTGASDSAWENENNWLLGGAISGYPDGNADIALIDSTGSAITTSGAIMIGEFRMETGFAGSVTTGNSFTIDDSGGLNGYFAVNAGTFDANDNTVTIDGNTMIGGGTLKTGTGTITFGNNAAADIAIVSAGELQIESDNVETDIVISNLLSWTNSGGTITYLNSGSSTTRFSDLAPYYNLAINSSGKTYSNDVVLDISGNLTITNGTLSLTNNMNLAGVFTVTGGYFKSNSRTVTLSGANATYKNGDIDPTHTTWTGGTLNIQSDIDQALPNGETYNILRLGRYDDAAGTTVYTRGTGFSFASSGLTIDSNARVALNITSATGVNKGYDGTTSATVSLGSDTITGFTNIGYTYTANFDTKEIGTNKAITFEGIVLTGADAGKYQLADDTASATADITARAITVTAGTDTKVYDGTTSSDTVPTITSGSLAPGDSATWTQVYANKHVDTLKTLIPSGTVNDGSGGHNYTVTFVNDTTGVITARPITVTAGSDTKVYDGTTSSDTVPTITSGSLGTGDTATWTQTYDTKNIGTLKTLTPAGSVNDGNSGNNYSVTFVPVNTGTITQADLTVIGITAASKIYDGTTNATLNTASAALVGVCGLDTVTLDTSAAVGAFINKEIGNNKLVTISGITIGGADVANYTLTQPTTTANITAIPNPDPTPPAPTPEETDHGTRENDVDTTPPTTIDNTNTDPGTGTGDSGNISGAGDTDNPPVSTDPHSDDDVKVDTGTKTDTTKTETTVEGDKSSSYGFDFSVIYQEEDKKYKSRYVQGKYRTVVIVFEGKVIAAPYSEKGVDEKRGVMVTAGNRVSQTLPSGIR